MTESIGQGGNPKISIPKLGGGAKWIDTYSTGPKKNTPAPTKTPAKTPSTPATDPSMQSAFDMLKSVLTDWGLGSLYNYAVGYLKQGLTGDEVTLKLQETPEYKLRFAGNELRKQKGLGTLSPAQYIALESQYRQILSQYGMPSGFYDQTSDFNNWIGGDVSPAELQSRAEVARSQYQSAPEEFRTYWREYGLTEGDAIAHILDPGHESLADLQRQAQAVQIGGSALQQGITVDRNRALSLSDNGVTLDQARQAYSRISSYGQTDSSIAQRFGLSFGQEDEEDSLLLNDGAAQKKRELMYAQEAAQFGGSGGASSKSNSVAGNY